MLQVNAILSIHTSITCYRDMGNPRGTIRNLKHYQPKWQSGATQVIRIPVALTEQIFEYAQILDRGETFQGHSSSHSESLVTVIQILNRVHETPRNNFSRERKALLQTAIDKLQSLVTSDIV